MENALAKEGKTCPAVPHPLNQLQFVDLSLDDSIAGRQSQASFDCRFISLHPSHKAPQFGDLTLLGFDKPGVKLLSCARAQHLGKLGNELINQLHFEMALTKLEESLPLLLVQVFISSQEEEGCLSWWQRSWSKLGSF